MLVYLPLYLFCFVGTHFAEMFKSKYDKEHNKSDLFKFSLIVFFIFLFLTLVSALRYGIGRDYFFSDEFQLNNYRDGKELLYSEPLIRLLATFVVDYNLPNQVYFAVLSVITNAAFIGAIFISKDNKFLLKMFVFIFYSLYISSFNQARQGVGIALGMFALNLLINYFDKRYTYIISFGVAILSMLFHTAEVINIAILIFYILFRKFGNKIKMKTVLIICFSLMALSPVLLITLKYTIEYIPFLSKYASYILGEDTSTEPVWRLLGSIFMYIVPMFTFVMFLLNFTEEEDYRFKAIIFYLSVNICFMTITALMNNLMTADRLKTMVHGLELFIFPFLFEKFQNKGKQTFVFQAISMTLMICITIGTYSVGKIYPYRSILFKDIFIY